MDPRADIELLREYTTNAVEEAFAELVTRVGTGTDWQAISRGGWFYQTLLKKDGSLWAMQLRNVTIGSPPEPLQLTRVDVGKDLMAFGAGQGHDAFGVALTREGEVWTWGKVLGEHTPDHPNLQSLAKLIGWSTHRFESKPVTRDNPWLLPDLDPSDPSTE